MSNHCEIFRCDLIEASSQKLCDPVLASAVSAARVRSYQSSKGKQFYPEKFIGMIYEKPPLQYSEGRIKKLVQGHALSNEERLEIPLHFLKKMDLRGKGIDICHKKNVVGEIVDQQVSDGTGNYWIVFQLYDDKQPSSAKVRDLVASGSINGLSLTSVECAATSAPHDTLHVEGIRVALCWRGARAGTLFTKVPETEMSGYKPSGTGGLQSSRVEASSTASAHCDDWCICSWLDLAMAQPAPTSTESKAPLQSPPAPASVAMASLDGMSGIEKKVIEAGNAQNQTTASTAPTPAPAPSGAGSGGPSPSSVPLTGGIRMAPPGMANPVHIGGGGSGYPGMHPHPHPQPASQTPASVPLFGAMPPLHTGSLFETNHDSSPQAYGAFLQGFVPGSHPHPNPYLGPRAQPLGYGQSYPPLNPGRAWAPPPSPHPYSHGPAQAPPGNGTAGGLGGATATDMNDNPMRPGILPTPPPGLGIGSYLPDRRADMRSWPQAMPEDAPDPYSHPYPYQPYANPYGSVGDPSYNPMAPRATSRDGRGRFMGRDRGMDIRGMGAPHSLGVPSDRREGEPVGADGGGGAKGSSSGDDILSRLESRLKALESAKAPESVSKSLKEGQSDPDPRTRSIFSDLAEDYLKETKTAASEDEKKQLVESLIKDAAQDPKLKKLLEKHAPKTERDLYAGVKSWLNSGRRGRLESSAPSGVSSTVTASGAALGGGRGVVPPGNKRQRVHASSIRLPYEHDSQSETTLGRPASTSADVKWLVIPAHPQHPSATHIQISANHKADLTLANRYLSRTASVGLV